MCLGKNLSTKSRDWSAWIDTIETIYAICLMIILPLGRDWSAWIDTIETQETLNWQIEKSKSGLICLNWYDWNMDSPLAKEISALSRDWSAWIDTIETWIHH